MKSWISIAALPLLVAAALSASAQQQPAMRVYGPGGPLAPMKEAAERFGAEKGVRVVVTAGPEAQWIDDARKNADLIFGGAEYMLTQFAVKYPELIDGTTREELYVRPSGVLVRKGNPKKIRTLEDLTRPGMRILDVAGAGQLGMWEDMAGSAELIDGIQKNIHAVVGNTADGIEKWKGDPSLDAWIIFESWHHRLKDVTDLVRLPESQRVYRGTPIAITRISKQKELAREFIRFLKSDRGKEIFVKWGWTDPDTRGSQTLTILHLNDLHGHVFPWQGWDSTFPGEERGGLDRIATAVDRVRAEVGEVLLLDAGDTIGDSMEARVTKGSVVVDAMNVIGFDAMTTGNHEPDFTPDVLAQRRDEARFPFLAANLRNADGSYFARPYILRRVAGITVGIIGLGYPNTALTTAKKNVEGLVFSDAIGAAKELVPRMRREGADIIIALTHLGLGHDQELARSVAGIDVIVGGHSHNRMAEAETVGSTLIVQAGAHGSDLGRLDLQVAEGKVVDHRRVLIPISELEPKASVGSLLLSGLEPSRQQREETIGNATSTIVRAQTIAGQKPEKRDAESPADSLFADLVRTATHADVVLLPGVGYGVAVQRGTIQARHLRNLIPHDSKISEVWLTTAELRSILERAIENVVTPDVREKVGGMIQVSGLEFQWSAEPPFGQRVVALRVGGTEPPADRRYRVVVNGLLAEGGHRQELLAEKEKKELGDFYDVVSAEIARRGSVATPPPGRIRRVTERLKKTR